MRRSAAVLLVFCLAGLGPASLETQAQPAPLPSANDLAIRWEVETNLIDDGARFRSVLTLVNRGDVPLKGKRWTLYFNFLREIDSTTVGAPVDITRINGDFYKLEPGTAFAPIPPGGQLRIPFEAPGSAIKHIDAPADFYVVFEGPDGTSKPPAVVSDVIVEPFTRPKQTKRAPNDVLPVPTPASRYRDNQSLSVRPADSVGRIVPTPVSTERRSGTFTLSADATIRYEKGLASEARQLAAGLAPVLGRRPRTTTEATDAAITLRRGNVTPPMADSARAEAYQLSVDPEAGIEIVGTTGAGVFYGVQSLEAWLPVDAYRAPSPPVAVPAVRITDGPRFDYRGLHLDVSRNFQSVEAVKRLLDIMAFYKLNTFHFHLTDDEGWRVAIDGLPELTKVGGRRGHTLTEQNHLVPSHGSGPNPAPSASPGSGWYSRADYLEILRYAKARHITVMPEIDVPGHARAAVQAMKARGRRLRAAGDTAAARRYRLHDPQDESTYESVQGWDDNVLNVCQPSTYRFLAKVVDELRALHETAGAPLPAVHVGGDEVPDGVWTKSPACDEYIARTEGVENADDLFGHFLARFQDTLATRGLTMAGWEEVGLEEATHQATTTTPNMTLVDQAVRPYVWSNIWGGGTEDRAYRLANAGYEVVMSQATNFYFDMAYSKHPRESGYYWAGFVDTQDPFSFVPFDLYKSADRTVMGQPINPDSAFADRVPLADSARSNILGLQGQLWGETLRSTRRMEYMAVPRLLSLAERAWAPQPKWATLENTKQRRRRRAVAWNAFANRLGQRELPRLSARVPNWSYRLPPPGAVVENGRLKVNVALPGLPVRYTTDGTTPTSASPRYTGPARVDDGATIKLRTFDTLGRGGRVVTVSAAP
jgi:hexosaminidase